MSHSYGEYLFPQANKINRADGKKGPFYSQAFTRLRRRVLPTATDRQCFHSLRGMFITCLDRAGVQETRIGSITGHTEQKAKTTAQSGGIGLEGKVQRGKKDREKVISLLRVVSIRLPMLIYGAKDADLMKILAWEILRLR